MPPTNRSISILFTADGGNIDPQGSAEDMFKAAQSMYDDMNGTFFRTLRSASLQNPCISLSVTFLPFQDTMTGLSYIRHSLDVDDEFYGKEQDYYDENHVVKHRIAEYGYLLSAVTDMPDTQIAHFDKVIE